MSIADNLLKIETRIQQACIRAGRNRNDITLVGVSKKHPAQAIIEALETTNLRNFGENYVQEYLEKRETLKDKPNAIYHLIGHLQRNKVRSLLSCPPDLIHSVDSIPLVDALERITAELYPDKKQPILVELRIGDENTDKTGLPPSQLAEIAEEIDRCPHIDWQGLMIIPPLGGDPEQSRPYFKQVHQLFDEINQRRSPKLTVLSYGMSDDFEVAIEEGATHLRIGTAIFGQRIY